MINLLSWRETQRAQTEKQLKQTLIMCGVMFTLTLCSYFLIKPALITQQALMKQLTTSVTDLKQHSRSLAKTAHYNQTNGLHKLVRLLYKNSQWLPLNALLTQLQLSKGHIILTGRCPASGTLPKILEQLQTLLQPWRLANVETTVATEGQIQFVIHLNPHAE